ncbi:GIN domain-containing protein [Kordia sp.]|uniref:GIN domain-containing protein n=1 Tax=Kordia sp. TaxID=1965332 RepID=UPI003D6C0D9B
MKKSKKRKLQKKMNTGTELPSILFFSFKNDTLEQSKTIAVNHFDKVVVSPHIQAVFKQGDQESITIEELTISSEKMNVEVSDNVLKVFLHKAEAEVSMDDDQSVNWEDNSIYSGTIAKIVITYKDLGKLALVGEEKFTFVDKIQQKDIKLKLIGKTKIYIKDAEIENLDITSFGKNYVDVSSGKTQHQNITVFGEDELNLINVENEVTQIKSLGNGKLKLNVSKKLKVTSLGNAHIMYKGDAKVSKGIMLGNSKVEKL